MSLRVSIDFRPFAFVLLLALGCGNTTGALPDTGAVSDGGFEAGPVEDDASVEDAPVVDVEVCMAQTPPESCPDPAPTYGDVAPIVQRRCSMCHGVGDKTWPLDTYHRLADWYDIVQSMLLDCTMPPLDGGVTMTADERATILAWIQCGRLP